MNLYKMCSRDSGSQSLNNSLKMVCYKGEQRNGARMEEGYIGDTGLFFICFFPDGRDYNSLFPDRSDLPCGGTIDRKQIAERIFQQVKGSWVELQNGGCSVGNRQFILCIREGTTCGHICGKYCIYFLGKMWSKDCFIWKELLQRATCVFLWKVELLFSC